METISMMFSSVFESLAGLLGELSGIFPAMLMVFFDWGDADAAYEEAAGEDEAEEETGGEDEEKEETSYETAEA